LASIRKDAFTVGVSKADSAAEYDFISEVTVKMKIPRFRLIPFENANAGQKLLLDGKIDAIIAKINHSPHLENKFLVSAPYGKTEIAVATSAKNSEIWTLADLNGKTLVFIPKDISSNQVLEIWQNSKPIAAQNLTDAIDLLQKKQATAIIANRQALEEKRSDLRLFPNKLAENNTVALFAPGSKNLQEEFNKAVKKDNPTSPINSYSNRERIAKILTQLNELKKEIELLQGELK
jgi:ABC-type amino acid transport substrate-binding protein